MQIDTELFNFVRFVANKLIKMKKILLTLCVFISIQSIAQKYNVVAYYTGDSTSLVKHNLTKVTHLIYSFGHIFDDNKFTIANKKWPGVLNAFTIIKKKYPHLKVMVALGGWGGCAPCSDKFNDVNARKVFVSSVKDFLDINDIDGFDLDWEYPSIEGYPGHAYAAYDKENFTSLVKELRAALGKKKIISFAAGGFQSFLDSSVNWYALQPYLDFVNLMSYDLVSGFATVTGHQTPLYSNGKTIESVDNAIRFFKKINFPLKKINIGSAFYTRNFVAVENVNNGLYQPAKFKSMYGYKQAQEMHTKEKGFIRYWDDATKSAYWYNAKTKTFATGDDAASIREKCAYIKKNKLGGFMFWELQLDTPTNFLLENVLLP